MGKIKYPGLCEFVQEKLKQKKDSTEIFNEACRTFNYKDRISSFRRYVNNIKYRHKDDSPNQPSNDQTIKENLPKDDVSEFLDIVSKQKNISIIDICNDLNCSPQRIDNLVSYHRSKGYDITIHEDMVMFFTDLVSSVEQVPQISETEITFGVASDLHFGSKAAQITALNEFCNICSKRGVKHIFSPGDIVAGYNVYPGQQFDLYALSAEEQEDSVIKNLPTGDFQWYMLGGNHDYAFIKKGGGHNPVLAIASKREDVHYVGFDDADIPILNGVELKLWHPSGGVPYSVSYRLQKGVEQISYSELRRIISGEKMAPTIRFVLSGHLHIQVQAMIGSIFGMQCGAFEGQTNYLKRKGLVPNIGGYIVNAELVKNGLIKNFDAKFYMFEDIEDDWRNYSHSIPKQKIVKPIFG
jgi:hypothetical protein